MRPLEGANQRCLEYDLDLDAGRVHLRVRRLLRQSRLRILDPRSAPRADRRGQVAGRADSSAAAARDTDAVRRVPARGSRRAIAPSTTSSTRAATFRSATDAQIFLARQARSFRGRRRLREPRRRLHPRSVRLRARHDQGAIDRRRNPHRRRRRMPGLCASHHRRAAPRRHPVALRLRLPRARREIHRRDGRRTSQSRMARSATSRPGMDRDSIPPTDAWSTSATSASPSAATTPTSPRCAAFIEVTAAGS